MFKKSVAVVSALLLSVLGLVALPTAAHAANIVLDMTGQSIKFDSSVQTVNTYQTTTAGDTTVYRNAATISGITIDAEIVRTIVGTASATADLASSAIASEPVTPVVYPYLTKAQLLQIDVTPGSGAGAAYAEYKFRFFESGTYTGPGTGNLITLRNLKVNCYDLDKVGGFQWAQFKSFQTYELSAAPAASTLAVSQPGSGWVMFKATNSGDYSANSGSFTMGRVRVSYDQLTEFSVRLGMDASSLAKHALDVGDGYPWKDSATRTFTTYNNPANTAPTSAAKTIYYSTGTPWVFSETVVPTTVIAAPNNYFDFPYQDAENNAFASVQVVTLPASGNLQLLVGSTWTNVTAGQVIPVTSIQNGMFRFNGTGTQTFTFKVYDGQAYSALAYTMTLSPATNAQTITFNNPGTKQVSATPFASGATASSGLTVTLMSLTPSTCTVTGLNITAVANGVCTIVATQSGNSSYSAAPPVTQSFNISSLQNQTITLNNPGTQTVNTNMGSAPTTTATGLSVTLVSLTTGVCTVSGSAPTYTVTHIAEGYCTLYATQGGNGTYAAASPVQQTYLVNAGALNPQVITFNAPANINTTTTTVNLSATATSALTVTFGSNTPSVCTVNGSGVVTILGPGACSITAYQSGNVSWAAAPTVTRIFYILAVTTTSLPSGVAGTAYSTTVNAFQGATGVYTWSATAGCLTGSGLTLNTSTGEVSGANPVAGTYTCTYSATDSGVTATKSLAIVIAASAPPAKTPNAITWAQLPNVSLTNGNITLGATSDGTAGSPATSIYYQSNTPTVCTVTGNVVTLVDTGYCELTADDDGNSTFDPASQAQNSFYIFAICTPSISSGFENQPYSQTFQTLGTVGAGTFSLTGALPTGLSLDPNTGVLSGNPSQPWNGSITVTYTQASGGTHTRTYSLIINAAPGATPPGGGGGGGGSTPSTPSTPTPTPTPTPTTPVTPTPTPTPTPSEPAQVELKAVVNFAGDSTKFVGNSTQIIRNLASNIKAEAPTAVVIKVDGYVNKTGDTSYDTKLAVARAKATVKALLAQGVEATVVTTVSKGIHSTTGTSARRAEVTVIVKK